jgi:hypothetical protein
MAMPLGKLDLLTGYGIAFGLMACVQVTLVLLVSLTWLGVTLPRLGSADGRHRGGRPTPCWLRYVACGGAAAGRR